MTPIYITSRQLAESLGCTQRNISFLIRDKKLKPSIILENGTFLFLKKEVSDFKLERKRIKTN